MEAEGDNGLVVMPEAVPSGLVAAPIGESGCVGGLSETVAFGRAPVFNIGEAGPVGVTDPSGAFEVLRAIVGAPTVGGFDVPSLMVGTPIAVGVGTCGLVVEPEVRGLVGAPVGATDLFTAEAVGVSGIVGVPPVGVRGLIGMPAGMPPGPAVLMGIVGAGVGTFDGKRGLPAVAGAFGGPAIGAVVAAIGAGVGVLVMAAAIGIVGGGVGAACAN
jgi:hypothetical protein